MKISRIKIKDILSARKRRAFIIGTYYARIKPKLVRLDTWIKKLDNKDLPVELLEIDSKQNPIEIVERVKDLPVELSEIDRAFNIVFRYFLCEDCMDKGHCDGCGCTMPDGIIPIGNSCHYKRWQGMIRNPLAYYRGEGYDLVLKKPIQKAFSQEEFNKLF